MSGPPHWRRRRQKWAFVCNSKWVKGDFGQENKDFDNRYSSSALDLGNSKPKNQIADSNWDDIISNVPTQTDNLNTHILRQIELNIKNTKEKQLQNARTRRKR